MLSCEKLNSMKSWCASKFGLDAMNLARRVRSITTTARYQPQSRRRTQQPETNHENSPSSITEPYPRQGLSGGFQPLHDRSLSYVLLTVSYLTTNTMIFCDAQRMAHIHESLLHHAERRHMLTPRMWQRLLKHGLQQRCG